MTRDPLERHAVLRVLIYTVTVVAVIYAGGMIWSIVAHYQDIVLLLFLAWIVAFIFQPLVDRLQRLGMRRVLAVALVYVALLVIAVGSIALAIPTLQVQVGRLAKELSGLLSAGNVSSLANQLAGLLTAIGFSAKDAHAMVSQLTSQIPTWTASLTRNAVTTAEGMVGTAATMLFDAVLVAILSFYIMLDGLKLSESLIARMPPAWIPDVRLFQGHVDQIFGGFLRAAVIVGGVYSALNWIVLAALGQPGGLIFALLAGVLLMVPFIGSFLALVPPFLLVLLDSPPSDLVRNLVIVVVATVIAQQVTMQIVAPRVMSAHVGLHPLIFFIALLIGLREAGAWGAVFSGPVAAVVVAMLDTFFERWQRRSSLYPNYPSEPVNPPTASSEGEHASEVSASVPEEAPPQSEMAPPLGSRR
jgi:predicted PurR-regulated permease PerM